jgi:phosphate:Na+ symporter
LQGTARLAAETPRQVANTHTIFSVATTFILIWFAGPLSRLAQLIVPARPQETKEPSEPLYLDESALTVPSLGLQRVSLELARLGDLVLAMVRRAPTVATDGRQEDLQSLLGQDDKIDRLESAILVYIGRLSEVEHTKEESRRMADLAQTAGNLEIISDVVTTNLVSLGQQRVAERIDLGRLWDESTSQFVDTVTRNLEQAVETIRQPDASKAEEVVAAKRRIEELAAAARDRFLKNLHLADTKDMLSFRLATGIIEQFKQVAHFARRIAEITKEW